EIHLDAFQSVALASLAAPALHVEAETSGFVAALPGFGKPRIEIADGREDLRVCGRVRPRCAADGGLIDLDDVLDQVEAGDREVLAGFRARPIHCLRCGSTQNVVNGSGFTTAGNAGRENKEAKRKVDFNVLQVVF